MWSNLVALILRNRLANLIVIGLITIFLGYHALNIEISYHMTRMLPQSDSASIHYQNFKEEFGQDGTSMFIGIRNKNLFQLEQYNAYYDLNKEIQSLEGVSEVLSVTRLFSLKKNQEKKSFDFYNVVNQKPDSQKELDSIKKDIYSLPFYKGKLYNPDNNTALAMVFLDQSKLNSKSRIALIQNIKKITDNYGQANNVEVHYSGLPYIRTKITQKTKKEIFLFVILALLIASTALFLFFRSFKAVFFPLIIVIASVIWLMGLIELLGFKITMLSAILPPLIIIIGVENCIFLLNKYHQEFKNHGNKIKSLSRMVQRVGNATFLTNLTTATGFAAFLITGNRSLMEFGLVASIGIMFVFVLSLFLIPIFFSYIDPPKIKHTKHLDNPFTKNVLKHIVNWVRKNRTLIYLTSGVLIIIGVIGMNQLQTNSKIVDDLAKKDVLYKDMMFFEDQVGGVLPFEITIDTKKPKGLLRLHNLQKMEQLQDTLAKYETFSSPLSLVEVVKFSKQAFFNGNPAFYSLPNNQEKNFILSYLPSMDNAENSLLDNLVDSNLQKTRISIQIANLGTDEVKRIKEDLRNKTNEIFPPADYDVQFTGSSIVSLKGSDYMIKNLKQSLLLAIVIIILLMTLLFNSFKMVFISMLPNLFPLLLTSALMGFLSIPVKPSTILIFSVALGISVDNTIHFLSRYRMELKMNNWYIKPSVYQALIETGYSMIYSSIVLFFGFIIFSMSSFGGIEAMGLLISFTLIVAVLSNLLLLPSLLLTLNKLVTTKTFKNPFLKIFNKPSELEEDNQD
ncbi:MAG: MMPL family transporter [Bacteroidales bacterium]|nr:MMPL family transporter [Bacteroidales bacterium]